MSNQRKPSAPSSAAPAEDFRPTAADRAALPPVAPEDRWTERKIAAFLRELGATQCVAGGGRSVGMSRQSAYKLRNRQKREPFDIAWEAAFQHGHDALHQAARV